MLSHLSVILDQGPTLRVWGLWGGNNTFARCTRMHCRVAFWGPAKLSGLSRTCKFDFSKDTFQLSAGSDPFWSGLILDWSWSLFSPALQPSKQREVWYERENTSQGITGSGSSLRKSLRALARACTFSMVDRISKLPWGQIFEREKQDTGKIPCLSLAWSFEHHCENHWSYTGHQLWWNQAWKKLSLQEFVDPFQSLPVGDLLNTLCHKEGHNDPVSPEDVCSQGK